MTIELQNIPLSDIDLGDRARKEYYIDEDFLDSIREKGIIQPITVCRSTGVRPYKLLAGGRRFTAAQSLELSEIPCVIRDSGGELDDREIEYLENAQRRDLTWQENLNLVTSIQQLMKDKYGERGSQSKTARFLDRSVGGISRVMGLAQTIERFPALLACTTEDEAVKKARKILEGAVVVQLGKQHAAAAVEAGITSSTVESTLSHHSGQIDDPYLFIARRAAAHYRIGDCFAGLQEMIDNKLTPPIQLVEVDPPYGIDLQTQKKGDSSRELDIYEEIPREKYREWTFELISKIDQVIPEDCRIIYWFGQEWYNTIVDAFESVSWSYDPIPCIWSKGSGQTNSPDLYLARTYETFMVATKGKGIPIASRGRANVFSCPPVSPTKKYHPTQKPLSLMTDILSTFGWPRGILLCPFLGSGVTLRAAYKHNMLPIGWELNESNKGSFIAAVESDIQEYIAKAKTPPVEEIDEEYDALYGDDDDDDDFDRNETDESRPF
jgi:ParB/RepB/Spo0J family partition protein